MKLKVKNNKRFGVQAFDFDIGDKN